VGSARANFDSRPWSPPDGRLGAKPVISGTKPGGHGENERRAVNVAARRIYRDHRLPAIFRGIGLNPLAPGNITYLMWMITGYRLVQAVTVASFGRLGDHGTPFIPRCTVKALTRSVRVIYVAAGRLHFSCASCWVDGTRTGVRVEEGWS
jgi:hypothetical protein